jgi:hypothetical protein
VPSAALSGELPAPVLLATGGLKLLLVRRPWPCPPSMTAPQFPEERFTAMQPGIGSYHQRYTIVQQRV